MAKAKKSSLIAFELEWLEEQAAQLKEYIDKKPLSKLKDRIHAKSGNIISKIEEQRKDLTAALREYASLMGDIDKLRTQEEAKKDNIRGDQNLTPFENEEIQ